MFFLVSAKNIQDHIYTEMVVSKQVDKSIPVLFHVFQNHERCCHQSGPTCDEVDEVREETCPPMFVCMHSNVHHVLTFVCLSMCACVHIYLIFIVTTSSLSPPHPLFLWLFPPSFPLGGRLYRSFCFTVAVQCPFPTEFPWWLPTAYKSYLKGREEGEGVGLAAVFGGVGGPSPFSPGSKASTSSSSRSLSASAFPSLSPH